MELKIFHVNFLLRKNHGIVLKTQDFLHCLTQSNNNEYLRAVKDHLKKDLV